MHRVDRAVTGRRCGGGPDRRVLNSKSSLFALPVRVGGKTCLRKGGISTLFCNDARNHEHQQERCHGDENCPTLTPILEHLAKGYAESRGYQKNREAL